MVYFPQKEQPRRFVCILRIEFVQCFRILQGHHPVDTILHSLYLSLRPKYQTTSLQLSLMQNKTNTS